MGRTFQSLRRGGSFTGETGPQLQRSVGDHSPRSTPFQIQWPFAFTLSLLHLGVTAAGKFLIFLYIGYVAGAVLGVVALFSMMRRRFVISPELGVYCAFVAWAAVTGPWVAWDREGLLSAVLRQLEIGYLFAVIGFHCSAHRSPASCLGVAIVVALALVGFGFAAGDFAKATEMEEQGGLVRGFRATSLTTNANGLGTQLLWGIAGLAFFWTRTRSWIVRVAFVGMGAVMVVGLVYSASRKSVIALVVFVVFWLILCHRRALLRHASGLAVILIVSPALVLGSVYALRHTYLGKRLGTVRQDLQDEDSSVRGRINLYRFGLAMLQEHPLEGVGLRQFEVRCPSGIYSHSEYMEVAATTGLVGATLYFSMFFLLLRRLRMVRLHARSDDLRYVAGHALAILAAYGFLGVGAPSFNSLSAWCVLPGLFGFAYAAEREILAERLGAGMEMETGPAGRHPRGAMRLSRAFGSARARFLRG